MARIHLITGGTRAGKSAYANSLAIAIEGARVFVATAQAHDDEMRARIARHKADRAAQNWRTIEEPINIADAIATCADARVVVIDCITLWVSNHLCANASLDEATIVGETTRLLDACARLNAHIYIVTGEVGLGGISPNAMARRYADLLGRVNQTIAARADEVTLVACGLPLRLKGNS